MNISFPGAHETTIDRKSVWNKTAFTLVSFSDHHGHCFIIISLYIKLICL
uniref:Uncharacterized protein n=1 Tax=Anguilla anguilla TaxID=7936 RepID=A0A0E9W3Q9_ANGAN